MKIKKNYQRPLTAIYAMEPERIASGSVVSDIPLDTVNDESQTMPMTGEEILPGNALSRMINILGN